MQSAAQQVEDGLAGVVGKRRNACEEGAAGKD